MSTLIIGGVPEHFNLPWTLAIEAFAFRTLGVEVVWRAFPDGTGAMMRAVEAKEVDIALVLTEGAVAHIANSGTTGIIGTWVESPLVWGVHAPPQGVISENFPHDARIAISRQGSGSHLMPLVYARQVGWTEGARLVEIGTLDGALNAYAAGTIDAFYWERTMTWPQVSQGRMRLHSTFQAPWPAFVAVRHRDASSDIDTQWAQVVLTMQHYLEELLAARGPFLDEVAARFSLPLAEVEDWFARTTWAPSLEVSAKGLGNAARELLAAGVIAQAITPEALVLSPGVVRFDDGNVAGEA